MAEATIIPYEGKMTRENAIDILRCRKDGNAIEALEMAIEALEQEPKTGWIPVSERLPDKLQDVLVTFYDAEGEYDVAYMRKTFNGAYKGQGAENEWVSSMGETTYADYEVSAWMPIPQYKAETE